MAFMTNSLDVDEKLQPLVPVPATLDDWSAKAWTDGIQIDRLNPFDRLLIDTMHHTYEITVIDPADAEVLIRGGDFFPEATPALVDGASLRSSFLKLHGIYIGFHIEMLVGGKRITTSRVRRISTPNSR